MSARLRSLLFACFAVALVVPTIAASAKPRGAATIIAMPNERFWAIMDESRDQDQQAQKTSLRRQLFALRPDEIAAWNMRLDQLMRASYRWDLWGAAYVAMGGASEDAFEYFRLWLIAQGHNRFEQVMADPDTLAEFAPSDPEQLDFEDLAHIAPDVWSAKTGRSWEKIPNISAFFEPTGYGTPSGQEFSEDPKELAARYPKLWRRFGTGS